MGSVLGKEFPVMTTGRDELRMMVPEL